jgi:hypothetical protein
MRITFETPARRAIRVGFCPKWQVNWHVRADRFVEGHLASVLESGHITAILRRLRGIREQMA